MGTPLANKGTLKKHVRFTLQAKKADVTPIGVLASGPVIANTCAVTLGNLIYQFSEAATKLNIENLVDTLSAYAFIMHQRIKLAL